MKVKIGGTVKDYRTVWMEGHLVRMIDQKALPSRFAIHTSRDHCETSIAISDMTVRGAPAIGATAAYAVCQAAFEFHGTEYEELMEYVEGAARLIKSMRPTAHDLFHAVDLIVGKIGATDSVEDARKTALVESASYADMSAEECRMIGKHGEKLIADGFSILTHCNAGALACVDYGTALSPVRTAHLNGKKILVYVDETRPRFQGSKLTAWELSQEDIPHYVIVDNAAGHYMSKGEIDMVIVGADRITRNGDVVNKIGTYEKAVVAKENGIPFFVAAPKSTFDQGTLDAREIVIEERSPDEVLKVGGVRVAPEDSLARNPGFDVTPARYVSGIITEKGIIK
ncbi:MAG: S-methyl-5-thioribose-1-phosphate isomerase [Candidatus Altiarchaeota archaeon]|nr:S-methyl-5-thioribose-1-phosphate isomerase [Candidatus Altiarchaeota archaeon]